MNNNRPKMERWQYINNLKNTSLSNLHPNWMLGFIDGEGSFQFRLAQQVSRNSKYIAANPTLDIAQSNHDVAILEAIKNYLDSRYVKPKFDTNSISETFNSPSVSRFVTNKEDNVINLLDKYPLQTQKKLDYEDWKELIQMKSKGFHKTEEGYKLMENVKSKINSYRK